MMSTEEIRRWTGKKVYDPTGEKIGTVDDFYLDKVSHEPEWLLVKRDFLGLREALVPFGHVELTRDRVVVPYDKEIVENAPRPGIDGRLEDEEELKLFEYYGLPQSESLRPPGQVGAGEGAPEVAIAEAAAPRAIPEEEAEIEAREGEDVETARAGREDEVSDIRRRREAERMAAASYRYPEDEEELGVAGGAAAPPESRVEGEPVLGSSRQVKVKKYMVTERTETTPLSEEEFEEPGEEKKAA